MICRPEAICARTPFDKVYFGNSGSEANEAMLKLARRFHHDRGDEERVEFVSTHNSFHGRTLAAMSASGKAAPSATAVTPSPSPTTPARW